MRQAPTDDESAAADCEGLDTDRHGRFKIARRLLQGGGVEILGHDGEAGQRSGVAERLLLSRQSRRPVDILVDRGGSLAGERIIVALQPLETLLATQGLIFCFSVEFADHAIEFVERAAETLAVLLSEFGQLRPDHREEKSYRQSQTARQHETASQALGRSMIESRPRRG
jgi:hypothetical protein